MLKVTQFKTSRTKKYGFLKFKKIKKRKEKNHARK